VSKLVYPVTTRPGDIDCAAMMSEASALALTLGDRMRPLCVLLCPAIVLLLSMAAPAATCSYPSFDPSNGNGCLSDEANGCVTEQPYVEATRIETGEEIVLDGRLDDPIWARAQAATGFRMWDPTRGADASEQTVFKVVYDDEAVYFGIACLESDA